MNETEIMGYHRTPTMVPNNNTIAPPSEHDTLIQCPPVAKLVRVIVHVALTGQEKNSMILLTSVPSQGHLLRQQKAVLHLYNA